MRAKSDLLLTRIYANIYISSFMLYMDAKQTTTWHTHMYLRTLNGTANKKIQHSQYEQQKRNIAYTQRSLWTNDNNSMSRLAALG